MGGYPRNKEYRKLVKAAEKTGQWTYRESSAQAKPAGVLRCSAGCCSLTVNATPKNPEGAARNLLKRLRACSEGCGRGL